MSNAPSAALQRFARRARERAKLVAGLRTHDHARVIDRYRVAVRGRSEIGTPELTLRRRELDEYILHASTEAQCEHRGRMRATASQVDDGLVGVLDAAFGTMSTSGATGSIEVYRWNGSAVVSMFATTQFGGVASMDWADIDSDGDADLAFCLGAQAFCACFIGRVRPSRRMRRTHWMCRVFD
ncbi:MAG: VCBS repeat-containing protein [Myxococcota bacterium]|nr:VCBS repeat-containing protein [Myxococcota bacterium]